jgi:hypothetical protein
LTQAEELHLEYGLIRLVRTFGGSGCHSRDAIPGDGLRFRSESTEFPFDPVVPEQLNWMLGSNSSIPTSKIIGRAVFIAPPARALRMFRMEWNFGLWHHCPFSVVFEEPSFSFEGS